MTPRKATSLFCEETSELVSRQVVEIFGFKFKQFANLPTSQWRDWKICVNITCELTTKL